MGFLIGFRNNRLKRLKITIDPNAQFHEIFAILNEISFTEDTISRDNVLYALLELVNNSLRALRETSRTDPIAISFISGDDTLEIEVLDHAGGFDPSTLPFDLSSPVEAVDLNDTKFQDYRKTHNNLRFGMGLYIARRTFPGFDLSFVTTDGRFVDWGNPDIIGTRIFLTTRMTEGPTEDSREFETLAAEGAGV